VWEAFVDQPAKGIKMLVNSNGDYADVYRYASKIPFYQNPQSYMVIRLAALFDLITFSTYTATAVLFSVLSFCGSWLLFNAFYQLKPTQAKLLAMAVLFLPSVVFWGSGLLKDTVTMACLGVATYYIFKLVINRQFRISYIVLVILVLYGLYVIKIYILMIFLPAIILWIFIYNFQRIKSTVIRIMAAPFVLILAAVSGYYAALSAVEDNAKYAFDSLAKTAQITAYDIRFWTGRDAGSGYTLGELDGTWNSLVRLAPEAINVSLFRPYLWEVTNPLMAIAAIESILFIVLTAYVLFYSRGWLITALKDPTVIFCLTFSLVFAFAVGVSTFNFGTLMRYKIPLLPYYLVALIFIFSYSKSARKSDVLDLTE
jgi:hypothetical protein